MKAKFYLAVMILTSLVLLMGACKGESGPSPEEESPSGPNQTPDIQISSATEARNAALAYLLEHESQNAPGAGLSWQEEDVTPKDEAGHPVPGAVHKEFTSGEWTIKVSYAVLPLERTVYQVVVSSIKLAWHWKGNVKADGTVTELSAFRQMSEEESQKMAEDFLKNSPTFTFDGIGDTLKLINTLRARCPYCWTFIYEFDSLHAGYGDRTGQGRAEDTTSHRVVITVEQFEIMSAMVDDRWDMLRRCIVDEHGQPTSVLSVAELLGNPVYDTEMLIHGEVSLLGELFCPCFELTSDGQTLQIWYDIMVENDGTERPAVDVREIKNGDRVIVTGELKDEGGTHYSPDDFWAIFIVVTPPPPPETPVSREEVTIDNAYDGKEIEIAVGNALIITLESNPTTGFEWELIEITSQLAEPVSREETERPDLEQEGPAPTTPVVVVPEELPARTVLKQAGNEYVPPEAEGVVGAAGKEIWTFYAEERGTSTISMAYRRSWEQDVEPARTYIVTVIVR